jgi:predicted branched-subunit amino acid permease
MLGFVLPALFFALLLEIRTLVAGRVLAGAGIAAACALLWLPSYAAIIAGMLAGALLALRFPVQAGAAAKAGPGQGGGR